MSEKTAEEHRDSIAQVLAQTGAQVVQALQDGGVPANGATAIGCIVVGVYQLHQDNPPKEVWTMVKGIVENAADSALNGTIPNMEGFIPVKDNGTLH